MEINVLSLGLGKYKSRSILLPLLRFKNRYSQSNININIFTSKSDELTNCDTLIIEDRQYVSGKKESPELTDEQTRELQQFSREVNQLLWFDTEDSTKIQMPSVFPYVDKYCKKQLLADRELYREPIQGYRLYSDYYRNEFGVQEKDQDASRNKFIQLTSEHDLGKLCVYWNIGHCIYSPAPDLLWKTLDKAPYTVAETILWESLLNYTGMWMPVETARQVDISGRFGTTYGRKTIEFHRKLMAKRLKNRFDSGTVGSVQYWRELQQSKVLLSPFGYGEVCIRDFEGFMSGCIVIKPEMDHVETWPPLYEDGETVVAVPWNMSELDETVDEVLQEYDEYKRIAKNGQEQYKKYLVGDTAADAFTERFRQLVSVE